MGKFYNYINFTLSAGHAKIEPVALEVATFGAKRSGTVNHKILN